MNTIIRTYSELIALPTFEERFKYLQLNGVVGRNTFGFDRYLNQYLYQESQKWKSVRDKIIVRDNACDLAMNDYTIFGRVIIHHMNPINANDIISDRDYIFDPEFLICVSHRTHNAIHYGDESLLPQAPIERKKNDTCPWRLN